MLIYLIILVVLGVAIIYCCGVNLIIMKRLTYANALCQQHVLNLAYEKAYSRHLRKRLKEYQEEKQKVESHEKVL